MSERTRLRLCYLADACTVLRLVGAGALVVMACNGIAQEWAVLVFALGELGDFADGKLIRYSGGYPQDGKRRWWREAFDGKFPEYYDQAADIVLLAATCFYMGMMLWAELAWVMAATMAGLGVVVQLWRQRRMRLIPCEDADPWRQNVIVGRRLYYVAMIALAVFALMYYRPGQEHSCLQLAFAITTAVALVGVAWEILWIFHVVPERLQRDKPAK